MSWGLSVSAPQTGMARASWNVSTGFRGNSGYESSRLFSSGELHNRDDILHTFRDSNHTETSQEILRALDNGTLRVRFSRTIARGGEATGQGYIRVNRTMNIDDILSTIVHEGRHELDVAAGTIPLPGEATGYQRAFAEFRAFSSAAEFAHKNKLINAQAFRHAGLHPSLLLESIIPAYNIHLSDFEFGQILREAGQ